jgi:hypothetical protein
LFYSDQAAQNIFNDVNPGALLDKAIRYYGSAEDQDAQGNYITNPPFANVLNAPTSCDLASTTGATAKCELAADVGSWFEGTSFPVGWDGPTSLKLKFESLCPTSALPSAFLACDGPCDATSKSGCCLLRNAFISQTAAGTCPQGYKLTHMNSSITNFLFENNTASKSNDTTLLNFISLLTSREIRFGAGAAAFVSVKGTEAQQSFCLIDGETLGNNTDKWATTAVTEDCAAPAPVGTKGCPRFLSGGLAGCAGAACVSAPVVVACPVTGCPIGPRAPTSAPTTTVAPTTQGTPAANPAPLLAPVFGLVGLLALF